MTTASAAEVPQDASPGFAVISPVDGSRSSIFPAYTVEAALEAARRAAEAQADWAALPFTTRRTVLLRAADLLEEESESVRAVFASEIGATAAWADMNVHEAAATLREAAGITSAPIGSVLPSQDAGTVNISERGPAGVILAIVPWNAPMVLAARSIAIALALGNSVVIRPSERSPRTAGALLAEVLVRAGIPSDILPVVTTRAGDGREVINALIDAAEISRVVFIGSTPVGRRIAERAGAALTPAVLELGGKNATILRADADLDEWIPKLAFSSFANSGQVCMCTDRIIAHESIAEAVATRLAAFADAMIVGDPRQSETDLGPVIGAEAATQFDALIDDVVSHGGTVLAGGSRDGLYVRPTVLTGVSPDSRFRTEEGFLPIVSVHSAADDAEAIRIANEGEYGLIASVISADVAAARRVARRVRAGAVHVNGPSVGDEPHVPFGGLGASGAGRLGGDESVRFFTTQRTFYEH